MRKAVTILLAFILFAAAVYCAIAGYRNYRHFVLSHGTSEASIRLDARGSFFVTVNPPGRSLFRPGGVLNIFVSRQGTPIPVEGVALGRGNLRVTDLTGHLNMECPLDELALTYSGGGQYYRVPEFDTSQGGPYRVGFEVTEPFRDLEGTEQKLVARHFLCGNEVLIHYSQFGIACLSGVASLFLAWRVCTANKTDAGNGSNGICRVIDASRSPSPDP